MNEGIINKDITKNTHTQKRIQYQPNLCQHHEFQTSDTNICKYITYT